MLGPIKRIPQAIAAAAKVMLGYDVVTDSRRRREIRRGLKREDDHLTPTDRAKLLAAARDLYRNMAIARWAVNKHLDFVSTVEFHPTSDSRRVNATLRTFFDNWAKPHNSDAIARFGFLELVRLVEALRTIDGDVFVVKQSDGRLHVVEGHRVLTPTGDAKKAPDGMRWVHGVLISERTGRPVKYAIHRQKPGGTGYELDKVVAAKNVFHVGYFSRYDQVRGVSPLAAAMNMFRDVYELEEAAITKAKVAEFFAMAIKQGGEEAIPPGEVETDASGNTGDLVSQLPKGAMLLNLWPGEDVEVVESRTPSTEMLAFTQFILLQALKALDIPYSFFDEAHTNYSGARQALILYTKSVKQRRKSLRNQFIEPAFRWRLGQEVFKNALPLNMEEARWEWIFDGLPWIDPLKEVNADIQAIRAGLRSRQEIRREKYGDDWETVVKQLAREEELLREFGLQVSDNQRGV